MQEELTTSHLGYATDNGAFYYYNVETGESYEQTLIDTQAYWESLDLPFHYVWWDSWWYYKYPDKSGGVKNWTAQTYDPSTASLDLRRRQISL